MQQIAFNGLIFEKIAADNLNAAIRIQHDIFPREHGERNFIDSIAGNPYRKELSWYLVKNKGEYIGLTGLYAYHNYPEDAWLGWFGIVEKHRGKGFGKIAFDFFEDQARQKGYKAIRLYTDSDDNKEAVAFYAARGMVAEEYSNPDDAVSSGGKTLIFSKSITDEPLKMWNNKNLELKEQEEKQTSG